MSPMPWCRGRCKTWLSGSLRACGHAVSYHLFTGLVRKVRDTEDDPRTGFVLELAQMNPTKHEPQTGTRGLNTTSPEIN